MNTKKVHLTQLNIFTYTAVYTFNYLKPLLLEKLHARQTVALNLLAASNAEFPLEFTRWPGRMFFQFLVGTLYQDTGHKGLRDEKGLVLGLR